MQKMTQLIYSRNVNLKDYLETQTFRHVNINQIREHLSKNSTEIGTALKIKVHVNITLNKINKN